MTILDVNILLYAWHKEESRHEVAKSWLEALLGSQEWVGLPWVTLWAFLRITTNSRIYTRPLPPAEALRIVDGWLNLPNVMIVEPGPRHREILLRMVTQGQASGPMLSDAVLAALAIEQGAVLASADRDFSRFPGLDWMDPLSA